MPQMSPLGWAWITGFVILGYLMFLVILYYMLLVKFEFVGEFFCVKCMIWVW